MPDEGKSQQESLEPLSVYALIAISFEQFVALAWQKMGLQPDPITHKMDRNIPQAKVAIDIASRLAEALDSELPADERRRYQNLMTDLKINLVRQADGDKKD